LAKTLALR